MLVKFGMSSIIILTHLIYYRTTLEGYNAGEEFYMCHKLHSKKKWIIVACFIFCVFLYCHDVQNIFGCFHISYLPLFVLLSE